MIFDSSLETEFKVLFRKEFPIFKLLLFNIPKGLWLTNRGKYLKNVAR